MVLFEKISKTAKFEEGIWNEWWCENVLLSSLVYQHTDIDVVLQYQQVFHQKISQWVKKSAQVQVLLICPTKMLEVKVMEHYKIGMQKTQGSQLLFLF